MAFRCLSVFLLIVCGGAFLAWNNVPSDPSPDEVRVLKQQFGIPAIHSYADEIQAVRHVQAETLRAVPHVKHVVRRERRPEELLRDAQGICYDRARLMELTFRSYGFEARRVAVFVTSSALEVLYKKLPSHAMLEVKTSKGWLLVDTRAPWIALDQDENPLSIDDLDNITEAERLTMPIPMNLLLAAPRVRLFGLYRRSGDYVAPDLPFPDINWGEFAGNFGV